ncbi:MAG: hypothetical protein GY856_28930 [bacterium]|nr:hypothetical protein [bacterium]
MDGERTGILDWLSRRLNLTEIFSLLTSFGLFYAEVDNRKPLPEALGEALGRPSQSYARGPRILGLIVVILIAVEILTGGLLALYYLPTPESAHASVSTILRHVSFGWFVHQVHFWGAQLLVAVLILRLIRFLVQGVYRAPRELVWVCGALLLLVCFHADLTGRILPWTSGAYWSGVRALEIIAAVPLYGDVGMFLIGGDEASISELTLIRSYILHIGLLPALAVLFIYLHFSTVRRIGLSEIAGEVKEVGSDFLRNHLANMAILLVLVIGVLVTLAVLVPTPFLAEADPYSTVPGVGPPWYLLAPFGFLELSSAVLPSWAAGTVLLLVFSAFVVLPLLDRSRPRRGASPLTLGLAVVAVVVWIGFTFYGARVA